MKRSEVFKNLFVDFIIFLFMLIKSPPTHTGEYSKAFHEISFSNLDLKHKHH